MRLFHLPRSLPWLLLLLAWAAVGQEPVTPETPRPVPKPAVKEAPKPPANEPVKDAAKTPAKSMSVEISGSPYQHLWSQRNEPMVDIAKACRGICIEMRYATERNLTGKQVYPTGARAMVRQSVAARLRHAQGELRKKGFGLKIWDAYRPAWAQDILWNALPDSQYLAAPARGGSYHSWGVSVDVTLVDAQGREQKMPCDFDQLGPAAKSEYAGNDPGIATRMTILRTAMKNAGFNGIRDEWWHFTAEDGGLFAPVDVPLEDGKR